MPVLKQVTARKELDLLVRAGLGVEPIAPALARVLREVMGAEGCFIGWFDEFGKPAGFFHDSALVEVQDLFMNNTKLFTGANEFTMFSAARKNSAAKVGSMFRPGKAFYKSNTFNLLIKPCGHHHALDMRVEVNKVTRVVFSLFRPEAHLFSEADAHRLKALYPVLQMVAFKPVATPNGENTDRDQSRFARTSGHVAADEMGHLLVSADGLRIKMINDQGAALLRLTKLFDQGVLLIKPMTIPPLFIQQLCGQLAPGSAAMAQSQMEVIGGSLVMTASWLKSVTHAANQESSNDGEAALDSSILVRIEYFKPVAIGIVRSISELGLSPLQSRIAMFAAIGGSRIECAVHHQISKEALKKHLREIYAASRFLDWHELHRTLNAR